MRTISRLNFDMGEKASLYADNSLRELGVIDVANDAAQVFTDPNPNGVGYRNRLRFAIDDRLIPGCHPNESLDLRALLSPEQPE
ncbi:MAG: hypothetical protein AAF539_06995 [Planctomycetota bacterium]